MTRITQNAKVLRHTWTTLGIAALLCFQSGPALAQETDDHPDHQAKAAQFHSKPLPGVMTPRLKRQNVARTHIKDPQTMKLLVIAVDGNEPTYSAIQAFLDQLGIPYDTFMSVNHLTNASQHPLPTFSASPWVANYYGIRLTLGNLAYVNT